MGDKETTLFALVHSGCKHNIDDTESFTKQQPDLIAGLGVQAMASQVFHASFSFSLRLFFPAQTTSFSQAEHPLFCTYFAHFQHGASLPAITTMRFHLTNHSTALTVAPARFPSIPCSTSAPD